MRGIVSHTPGVSHGFSYSERSEQGYTIEKWSMFSFQGRLGMLTSHQNELNGGIDETRFEREPLHRILSKPGHEKSVMLTVMRHSMVKMLCHNYELRRDIS